MCTSIVAWRKSATDGLAPDATTTEAITTEVMTTRPDVEVRTGTWPPPNAWGAAGDQLRMAPPL
ncbi:hypothetical protein CHELA40_10130 [Chelatococcus asaccharovorans]|nr:hypothetical protein CHELA40_10130 [Chelatococcus asaccharovorans]